MLILVLLLSSGCAHLEVTEHEIYPFRAVFDVKGVIDGEEINTTGALLVTSRSSAIAQIYGPGGLAIYTTEISEGTLVLKDTWARVVHSSSVPVKDIVGVIAGDVPRGVYLRRTRAESRDLITYPWGKLLVDSLMRPRQVHLKTTPALEIHLTPGYPDLLLLIMRGSDTVLVSMAITQGGRWRER
ncbi:MAG TPA: hypothetical protein ENN34_02755 [Deltaproteobacteria bacterium]|nr:hypothetical protein [Deltaproteobacteria bacterium]